MWVVYSIGDDELTNGSREASRGAIRCDRNCGQKPQLFNSLALLHPLPHIPSTLLSDMLVLSLAVQLAVLSALGFASPVEKKRGAGAAILTMPAKASMVTRSSSGKVFDKERALAEKVRVAAKYAGKPTGQSSVVHAERSEGAHFDINTLRRRATSAKEPLTDDYDGIDERERGLRFCLRG